MNLLESEIKVAIEKTLKKKYPEHQLAVKIEYPAQEVFGDYACAAPLQLAKLTGENPRKIAEELKAEIVAPAFVSKIEIAGAGFLNFTISPQFLTEFLQKIIEKGEAAGRVDYFKGRTVVTDISHPNVAKPMGVHHLLSTIIGNSLNKIFAAAGYKVIRDNYLGDWGTQFGKLIYAYKTWGDEEQVRKNPIPELLKLYVKFHDVVETDPSIEDLGRAEFKKLEDGDEKNRKLWEWIRELSIVEFEKMYNRLGVTFDFINGESFYEDKMGAIIEMGKKKGLFVKGEGGALIAPMDDPKIPPCIIMKSDGATLYATRDLARIKYWEEKWHPDLMINVVDMAQSLYFRQLFEVTEKLKITDAKNIHVSFGRMRFAEKKMSTRKGNIIALEEVLDEAEERARKIVEEKNPELSEVAKKEIARKVGIGAVKFAVLSQNRTTDVVFAWDKILSLEGMSAPYLQYVYARAKSILRKSQNRGGREQPLYVLKENEEISVARLLPKFPEVVIEAAKEFRPNLIANYLFELASRFNGFYASVPVMKAENDDVKNARLALVAATAQILSNGLALLGIEAPEEM